MIKSSRSRCQSLRSGRNSVAPKKGGRGLGLNLARRRRKGRYSLTRKILSLKEKKKKGNNLPRSIGGSKLKLKRGKRQKNSRRSRPEEKKVNRLFDRGGKENHCPHWGGDGKLNLFPEKLPRGKRPREKKKEHKKACRPWRLRGTWHHSKGHPPLGKKGGIDREQKWLSCPENHGGASWVPLYYG